jgi:hypothetical protein
MLYSSRINRASSTVGLFAIPFLLNTLEP